MPGITDIEGLPVVGSTGRRLGVVQRVLFHPGEPRAVGLMIVVPPLFGLVERKPRFLPLTTAMIAECGDSEEVAYDKPRLPVVPGSERSLGFSWDETVIWRNMEVTVDGGPRVGRIADVVVSRKTLKVLRVKLSEGSMSDVAVGRTEVPGELVRGFDGKSVVVSPEFLEIAPAGGAAKASGTGFAYAKHGVGKAADAMTAAGVAGLGALEQSFRGGLGRKALEGLRKARERAAEAMRSGDEDA